MMDSYFDQLDTDTLQHRLLDAYAALRNTTTETETIQQLKGELYRRGAESSEIVTIALAALIKQNRN